MMQRRTVLAGAIGSVAAPLLGLSTHARAQLAGNAFIVSGFPPGGMGDMVARPLAEKLRGKYAESLLLDSRPGAGGRIAAEYVKRAAPDGMTILQIPGSIMALYPHIYSKLPFDPVADFVPVSTLCTYVYSFTAGPGLPAEIKTVADYVKWARANTAKAVYGIPAAGSALHFAGMMLQRAAKFDFNSVPYRGGAPLLQDLLGGQVPVSFNVLGEVLPQSRAASCARSAVTSPKRSPFMPETPTMVEQGYPDIALQEWLGWFVPAKTPNDLVQKLNAQVRDGLQSPDLVEGLARNALRADGAVAGGVRRHAQARSGTLGPDRESHRIQGRGVSAWRLDATDRRAGARALPGGRAGRLRVRHRQRQAHAAAACAVAHAVDPLRRPAPRGGRRDDGRRGIRRHRARGRRARRDGPGRPQPGIGRRRRVQQQPGRAADHHQPAPRRRLSAPRHVHGHGHARRVRAADQVERGRHRRAPHPGAGAHGVSRSAQRPARSGAPGHPARRAGRRVRLPRR